MPVVCHGGPLGGSTFDVRCLTPNFKFGRIRDPASPTWPNSFWIPLWMAGRGIKIRIKSRSIGWSNTGAISLSFSLT